MPRPPRSAYPGGFFHAGTRGNSRCRVFLDATDYTVFLIERERSAGDVEGVSNILGLLGLAVLDRGDERDAIQLLRQSAGLARELGHTRTIAARALQGLAALLATHGRGERAAAALGFAEALLEESESRLGDLAEQLQDRTLGRIRSEVDEAGLARAWAEGRRLQLDGDLDALIAEAQQVLD